MKNKVTVKDLNGKTLSVYKDDERYLSGKLIPIRKNKISVKDSNGKMYQVNKNDSRYVSGELVPIRKGLVAVKDKNGNTFSVDKNDPRYLSGELVPIWQGKKHSKKTINKMKATKKDSQRGSKNSQYGTIWIHNPETKEVKKIKKTDIIPVKWEKGRK